MNTPKPGKHRKDYHPPLSYSWYRHWSVDCRIFLSLSIGRVFGTVHLCNICDSGAVTRQNRSDYLNNNGYCDGIAGGYRSQITGDTNITVVDA